MTKNKMTMKIVNKKQLAFVLKADLMMNRGYFRKSFLRRIYEIFVPDYVMDYLVAMRKLNYLTPSQQYANSLAARVICLLRLPIYLYYKRKFILLGYKLGFSIGEFCFGYGLVLHHHGTIVVGGNNRIGNYACINTSTLIINNGSKIGDGLFLGSGAKITKGVALGNNMWIGANSVITKPCPESNTFIAGIPAKEKSINQGGWYQYLYKEEWYRRYVKCETLKEEMGLNL